MSDELRTFELTGPGAARALEWLHVHCELAGVHERDDGALQVWLAGPIPALPFDDVLVRERPVHAADFARTGREGDRPIHVAADLLVRPPWVASPPDFRGLELIVPRGGAFGSGEHASTQAALGLLHRVWDGPSSFADVGTGSGILALYATARGCPAVQACDVDPAAVAAARELLPGATVRLGGPEVLEPADGVVANLTAAELHAALPALLALWRGRSALVLSGLRQHEVAPLVARLPSAPAATLAVPPFTAVALSPSARP